MRKLYKKSLEAFGHVKERYEGIVSKTESSGSPDSPSLQEIKETLRELTTAGGKVYILEHRLELGKMFRSLRLRVKYDPEGSAELPSQIDEVREERKLVNLADIK